MPTTGKYCKAYPLKTFRQFAGWTETLEEVRRREVCDEHGIPVEVDRSPSLTDDDYLYLQENYIVTEGIFKDRYIVFETVTPAWIEFCRQTLKFEIPAYARSPATAGMNSKSAAG